MPTTPVNRWMDVGDLTAIISHTETHLGDTRLNVVLLNRGDDPVPATVSVESQEKHSAREAAGGRTPTVVPGRSVVHRTFKVPSGRRDMPVMLRISRDDSEPESLKNLYLHGAVP